MASFLKSHFFVHDVIFEVEKKLELSNTVLHHLSLSRENRHLDRKWLEILARE